MKEIIFVVIFAFIGCKNIFSQSYPAYSPYPFYLYGNGLNGSIYQIFALYADTDNGVLFEAPLDSNGNKLPFSFSWRGNGVSRSALYISPDSKVGIGTNDPVSKISVQQSGDGSLISAKSAYTGNKAIFEVTQEYWDGFLYLRTALGADVTKLSGHMNSPSYFMSNVGIGTNAPTHKLDVRGTVRANEVVVNTGGADFVFASDYRLRPLPEVERFIAENKHLPDIAPADSMVKNGVNMGELQIQLLQKIEELTLYVIEQGKQNEELKKQLQAQQREIEELKIINR